MTSVPRLSEACWLVTNGDKTVGPVHMSALLDGFDRGVVSAECLVRQPDWPEWRALSQTREYRALHDSKPAMSDDLSRKVLDLLSGASDRAEVVHCALSAAMFATGAAFGWGHRRAGKRGEFMTVCKRGAVPDKLGQTALGASDPVLVRARAGEVIAGAPSSGDAEGAIARRFGSAQVRGVAMVPVIEPSELWGVVEMARTDHAFRRADRRMLAMIAHHARERLS
jgi:GAF domain-containing protein